MSKHHFNYTTTLQPYHHTLCYTACTLAITIIIVIKILINFRATTTTHVGHILLSQHEILHGRFSNTNLITTRYIQGVVG